MSIGLDRFLAALAHLKLMPTVTPAPEVLVVTVGNVPTTESLKLANELRSAGIRTEVFVASKKKMTLSNQLSHADHYGVPIAVILGEDEVGNGLASIKDLQEGKRQREAIKDREAYRAAGKTGQVTVPRHKLIETVRVLLQNQLGRG